MFMAQIMDVRSPQSLTLIWNNLSSRETAREIKASYNEFMARIMDAAHSPSALPASPATATTPEQAGGKLSSPGRIFGHFPFNTRHQVDA